MAFPSGKSSRVFVLLVEEVINLIANVALIPVFVEVLGQTKTIVYETYFAKKVF